MQNARNLKRRVDNKSGVTGVRWMKKNERWQAEIHVNGKFIYLGQYRIFDDAVEARRAAEVAHDFHSNHGRHNQETAA